MENYKFKETFSVPPKDARYVKFEVKSNEQIFLFDINVEQIPNRSDDIQVFIMDEENYQKYIEYFNAFTSGQSTQNLRYVTFLSSKIQWGPIFFNTKKLGTYYLVLDNTHSVFTKKIVHVAGSTAGDPFDKRTESIKKSSQSLDFFNLHPEIAKTCQKLFNNGHYSEAIFTACKVLETQLKKKSKINKIGESLANDALNENNPIIKLNKNKTREEINEQRGFRFLFAGAFVGIKNPKSHSIQDLQDRIKATEYLSLISLLLRRLDEAKVRRRKNNEISS